MTPRISLSGKNALIKSAVLIVVTSLLLLTGCGGGGGSDGIGNDPLVVDDPVVVDDPLVVDDPVVVDDPLVIDDPVVVDSDGDLQGSNFFLSNNNSARLSGPVIGSNAGSIDQIRKELTLTKASSNPDLVLRQVYAIRTINPLATVSTEIIGVLQNVSQQVICAVRIEGMETRDSNGQPTSEQPFQTAAFIDGSIGFVASLRSFAPSCVAPNEYVYFNTTGFIEYDDIAEFNFDTLEPFTFGPIQSFSSPSLGVAPLSYTVNGSEISVLIANQTSSDILFNSMVLYVLDENGFPLAVSSPLALSGQAIDTVLSPGQEITVISRVDDRAASGSTLRPIVEFTEP